VRTGTNTCLGRTPKPLMVPTPRPHPHTRRTTNECHYKTDDRNDHPQRTSNHNVGSSSQHQPPSSHNSERKCTHERMYGHAREHDRPTDDSNPSDMSNVTCYGCGEKGHITKDPKCKNFRKSKPSAKMFMAREILDEDDDGQADNRVVDQDRESGDHDQNDQTPWDQYDSDVVGS